MRRLNLGAGDRIVAGAVNHDLRKHREEIDLVHDLNERPWPLPDNHFDLIEAVSVLEHLKLTLVESLDECWRVTAPGGVLEIKYPLYGSPVIHDDPTHRWYWSERVLEFFDPDTKYGADKGFYTERKWRIVSLETISDRSVWAKLQVRK